MLIMHIGLLMMPRELLVSDASIRSISLKSMIIILEASFDDRNMFKIQAIE